MTVLAKYELTGKTALITGAARGIGLEIAKTLAGAGASVVLCDLDGTAVRAAAESVSKDAQAHAVDVGNPEAVRALASQLSTCPDILVNNAGVGTSGPTESVTDEQWKFVNSVNYDGVFYCCRAFGPRMAARGSGSIVNIGSMSGLISPKPEISLAYNASKAAVHSLTKTLACEWAQTGVRVNAVAPGYVESDMTANNKFDHSTWMSMTPMGRFARKEEIAAAVHFLACDAVPYMTGTILSVDGGYTSW